MYIIYIHTVRLPTFIGPEFMAGELANRQSERWSYLSLDLSWTIKTLTLVETWVKTSVKTLVIQLQIGWWITAAHIPQPSPFISELRPKSRTPTSGAGPGPWPGGSLTFPRFRRWTPYEPAVVVIWLILYPLVNCFDIYIYTFIYIYPVNYNYDILWL